MNKILLIAMLTSVISLASAKPVYTVNNVKQLNKASTSDYSLFNNKVHTKNVCYLMYACNKDLSLCLSEGGFSTNICLREYQACLFDLCGINNLP